MKYPKCPTCDPLLIAGRVRHELGCKAVADLVDAPAAIVTPRAPRAIRNYDPFEVS